METSFETCESTFSLVELGADSVPALPAQAAQTSEVPARAFLDSLTVFLALSVSVLLSAAVVVQGLDWSGIRSRIRAAAQLELTEDFRNDLAGWAADTGAPNDWAFNGSGFAAPGRLAIYIKSILATDYRVQFRATVGQENLGFVYRAMDFHRLLRRRDRPPGRPVRVDHA